MQLFGTRSFLNGLITTLLLSRFTLAIELDINDKGMSHGFSYLL